MTSLPYTYDPRAERPAWKNWAMRGLLAMLLTVFVWRAYEKYYVGLPYGPVTTWVDIVVDLFFALAMGWTVYRSFRADPLPALTIDGAGVSTRL